MKCSLAPLFTRASAFQTTCAVKAAPKRLPLPSLPETLKQDPVHLWLEANSASHLSPLHSAVSLFNRSGLQAHGPPAPTATWTRDPRRASSPALPSAPPAPLPRSHRGGTGAIFRRYFSVAQHRGMWTRAALAGKRGRAWALAPEGWRPPQPHRRCGLLPPAARHAATGGRCSP